jgi:xanthine dehydrogenase accessory factor
MDIYQKSLQFVCERKSFLLAVVLSADGSTPQKPGARALIEATGQIWGTIGGGHVEAEAQRRAAEVCHSKKPVVLDFHLDNAYTGGKGPICGGTMRILLDPLPEQARDCFASAAQSLQQRRCGVLLTTIRLTDPVEVKSDWLAEEAIPRFDKFPDSQAIRSCLDREMPRLFMDPNTSPQVEVQVFVEPVVPKPHLVIAGGGHIGQALAVQAGLVGFDVTVIDDRPEFTAPALFPQGAATCCGPMPELTAAAAAEPDTYIVIVTREHARDAETLAACIRSPAAYIGMIGSRRKVALMRQSFLEQGLAAEAQWNRVFTPIGLDIGSVTVPEIAASITAQLIAVRRKATRPLSLWERGKG